MDLPTDYWEIEKSDSFSSWLASSMIGIIKAFYSDIYSKLSFYSRKLLSPVPMLDELLLTSSSFWKSSLSMLNMISSICMRRSSESSNLFQLSAEFENICSSKSSSCCSGCWWGWLSLGIGTCGDTSNCFASFNLAAWDCC